MSGPFERLDVRTLQSQSPALSLVVDSSCVRSVLYLTNDVVRIESHRRAPNLWIRFWHRALLGWRWERLP